MKNLRLATLMLAVIPVGALILVSAGELSAQTTRQNSGKTYLQSQGKWFVEEQGRRYEVDPRIITIKFRGEAELIAKRKFYVNKQLKEIRRNRLGYIDVAIPAGIVPLEFIEELRKDPLIESAEVNTIGEYLPVPTPDDPKFPDQWHLPKTNVAPNPVDSAWAITTGSSDIIVAVVDSGTDVAHEDLIGNSWINAREDLDNDGTLVPTNPDHLDNDDKNGIDDDGNGYVDDLVGWDFVNDDNDVRGPFYHGTHVAGIVAAMTNSGIGVAGVAGGFSGSPGTRVMALGVGDFAPSSSALDDAIIYAADNGARIVTMSLSVASSSAIDAAIDYAHDQKGVFIDNAAGNSGSAVAYPAINPKVVAVSSTDKADVISAFSNRGPEIELAAPGEEIWSTRNNDNYGEGDGTSYASPQVAGAAALLLACNPDLSNEDIRTLLHTSAEDLGTAGKDDLYGYGRLDTLAALEAADCAATPKVEYVYPAKIVCGLKKDAEDLRLVPGRYATAINVLNSNHEAVRLRKTLALTFPPAAQRPGEVIPLGEHTLDPDHALEVDCQDVRRKVFPKGFPSGYVKGFVIVRSTEPLDVTAVYTAAALQQGLQGPEPCTKAPCSSNVSIDVEAIPERRRGPIPEDQEQADLIPVPDPRPGHGFCRLKDGKLLVTVRNQGSASAQASIVEVDFGQYGRFSKQVPILAPSTSADTLFDIPRGCYNPDCDFTIRVDKQDEVSESNEANNEGSGICIG